jgi:hypothetical protein
MDASLWLTIVPSIGSQAVMSTFPVGRARHSTIIPMSVSERNSSRVNIKTKGRYHMKGVSGGPWSEGSSFHGFPWRGPIGGMLP